MKPKPIEENETQRVSEGTGLRVRIAQTEEKEWFDRVVEENHELGAGIAVAMVVVVGAAVVAAARTTSAQTKAIPLVTTTAAAKYE